MTKFFQMIQSVADADKRQFNSIKDLTIEMVLTFKEIYGASFVDTLILELYKKGVFEASEYDDYINQKNNEEIL